MTYHIDSNLLIRNSYYSATIPIWRDKLPLSLPELNKWEEEWLKEEAGEVIRAVGAWVLVFRKAANEGGDEGEVVRKHFLLFCVWARGGQTRVRRGSGHGFQLYLFDLESVIMRSQSKNYHYSLFPISPPLFFLLTPIRPQNPRLFSHTDLVAHPPPPFHCFKAPRTKHNSLFPRS